ncbi:MAG: hypothetical protein WBC19_07635 [Pyrinomonadaceae bacterium]|nr:hypothetical protein [Chloracidobacterium sp.]
MNRFIFTIILMLGAASFVVTAQGTFTPRDSDEEQAWRLYNQYKESRRVEAPLDAQIKAKFNDALMAAYGALAGKAVDPGDVAEVRALREKMETERKRQADLLAAWERKFYWRYGDLRWFNDKIRDGKTGREMDRIEFALTYFPFNYVPAKTATVNTTPTPEAPRPTSADSTSLTLELPGYWGHLSYTITGARLDPPTGGDRGNVAGRQYTGELTGSTLTVSGKAVSDNPSSGPGSMDYYEIVVSVAAGKEKKEYGYIAQKGEKLNKSFSLSVPVTPGATGSFSISLMEQNANYGPHGWVVGGNLGAAKAVSNSNEKPLTALAGTWSCSDGGTYQIKQSGTSITWEGASADGGRTWSHTFVGTIQGDKIVGRFEDHPPGRFTGRGDLTLRIIGRSKLEYVSSSVPFGGRVWSR